MERRLKAAILLLCLPIPITAMAQSSGAARLGKALAGNREDPAAQIIPVSFDGRTGSDIYAKCLANNTTKYGAMTNDADAAVRSAFADCMHERSQFYSAVYGDIRKSERQGPAIRMANQILEMFDRDSVASLPKFALEAAAKQKVMASTPAPNNDKYDQLAKLKALLDSGAITQDEYNKEKGDVLAGRAQ